MLTLGIESATDYGAVALCRGSALLGEISFAGRMGQAEKLVPAIEALLRFQRVEQRELQLIAVALGPGSFTGLRIGVASAKGLAQALRIPLVGVASAEAFASRAALFDAVQCVVLADRRNLVYTAIFEKGEKISPEASHPIEAVIEALQMRREKIVCIGTGAEEHREKLAALPNVRIAPTTLNVPSALEIAHLGFEKFVKYQNDELFTLEPLYVQRLMAEVRAGS